MKNFEKKHLDTTTVDFDYDYDSIMHYGTLFFRYIKYIPMGEAITQWSEISVFSVGNTFDQLRIILDLVGHDDLLKKILCSKYDLANT